MKKTKIELGGQILYIPVDLLVSDPMKPRIYFDTEEMQCLCNSISENGIIKPLTVRALKNGRYSIISGERRLKAAVANNMDRIPCIIMNYSNEAAAFAAINENLRQCNLNYFEIAVSIERLHKVFFLPYEVIAQRLEISLNELYAKLRLLSIQPDLRKKMIESGITENHAKEIVKLNDDKKAEMVDEIILYKLNVSKTRQRCNEIAGFEHSKNQKTVAYIKDVVIFTNTIDKAINTMKSCGIKTKSIKNESANEIEYKILITK